ncbi:MAG: GNAT family N-acetyltransferase [Tyzzerella sp.]|nr:GNAT family N-acetyltransferase [Tyzzerella sp.]
MHGYNIREIKKRDNAGVESLIRTCLLEFGGNREGTAWCDPDLGRFSEIYNKPGHKYWVAENAQGQIVGGAGIGGLTPEVCELQKMYCLKEARGTGVAHELMKLCLEYAKQYYKKCYLETFSNMIAANKFYGKYEFQKLDKPFLETVHFGCDVWYIKDLLEK